MPDISTYKVIADVIVSPTDTIVIGSDVEQTYINSISLDNKVAVRGDIPTLYCGSFENSTTLTNAGITSSNLVSFDTTSTSKGITVVTDGTGMSRITFANSGRYLINFLGQFAFTGGASNYNITVWWTKNGTIVTNGSSTFTTTSSQNSQIMANVEDIIDVTAGDYIQFYWWAGASGISLTPTAAASNPTRPASPSVKLNIFNVG